MEHFRKGFKNTINEYIVKRVLFFLSASAIIIAACKDKKQSPGKETEHQDINFIADSAKDSSEIRAVITSFYNWYSTNYSRLMKYDLYSGISKEDGPPYKINWSEVVKYQQFIRDSIPQLGESFLQLQKHFFEQCDSAFKKDVEDDIPYGFDYDWYTNSQEDVQYRLDQINGPYTWIIKSEGNQANVQIGGSRPEIDIFVLYMKKENGKWTIAQVADNDW